MKVILIVGSITAQSHCIREGLAEASRSSNSLLIVEALGRNVGKNDTFKRTDVYADLHRRRHSQRIYAVGQLGFAYR
jgi:ribosomal protein S24E